MGDLECKRRRSSSCDRNTSEHDNSVGDSGVEISKKETSQLSIPNIERPSTSKELDKLLFDGGLGIDDESEDDILKDLKSLSKGVRSLAKL